MLLKKNSIISKQGAKDGEISKKKNSRGIKYVNITKIKYHYIVNISLT